MKLFFDKITQPYPIILLLFACLVLSGVACKLDAGGPLPPYDPVPVSTEAAEELEKIVQNADAGSDSSYLAFTLSEPQVSSFLVELLSNHAGFTFSDPQVYLRNQQVEIYGKIQHEYFEADTCFIFRLLPAEDGTLKVYLLYGEIGMFRLPNEWLNGISSLLQEGIKITQLIKGTFSSALMIETLDISNGMITVTGTNR